MLKKRNGDDDDDDDLHMNLMSQMKSFGKNSLSASLSHSYDLCMRLTVLGNLNFDLFFRRSFAIKQFLISCTTFWVRLIFFLCWRCKFAWFYFSFGLRVWFVGQYLRVIKFSKLADFFFSKHCFEGTRSEYNAITAEWKLHSQCKTDFNKSNKYVNSLAENAFVCVSRKISFHFFRSLFFSHSSTRWKYKNDFDANGAQEFCKRASEMDMIEVKDDVTKKFHAFICESYDIRIYVYQLLWIENDSKSTYSTNTNTQFHKNNNIEENSFNARDTLLNGFFLFSLEKLFFFHSNAGLDGWLVIISVFFSLALKKSDSL